jgi:hypothetical protein
MSRRIRNELWTTRHISAHIVPISYFAASLTLRHVANIMARVAEYRIMATGRHSFKHNDMARAIRATKAAGLTIRSVTLNGGAITLLVDAPAAAAGGSKPNDWAEVLEDAPDQKRPS